MSLQSRVSYEFGPFRLNPAQQLLAEGTKRVPLTPKAFQILLALVESQGQILSKEELLQRVWPDTFVEEATLAQNVFTLRKVLKDNPGTSHYIETIPKRGYRFIARVTETASKFPEHAAEGRHDGTQARQEIRFCSTRDGVRIAWASVGSGYPLVKAANWLNHLDYEWESPVWKHWIAELTKHHRFVRYDERGNGLSDREVKDISLDAWVQDLETVVNFAGLDRFALMGISQGGAPAIRYAVRYPERVSHLILIGAYSRGWEHRDNPEALEARHAFEMLVRLDWGAKNPAFCFNFANLYVPENATPEHQEWFNDLRRVSASPENAARIMDACDKINVRALLPLVSVPTIVFHSDGDRAVSSDEGRILAAEIPNAKFVPLSSANHLLLADEPAWRTFVEELGTFLGW
ncbi:MAG TPA: alpha/beta fold hydrolase [Terriglobales bacterium]|jgi:DNA-binding winged helix-turn-helix (wHTH) protein/alpha-beta hydrolase superfamily lysophospholipase